MAAEAFGGGAEKGGVLRTGADRAGCDEDRNAYRVEEGETRWGRESKDDNLHGVERGGREIAVVRKGWTKIK